MAIVPHQPSLIATLLREMRSSYAFIERNLFLTRRYWGWEVVWIVYSIVNAISITFIAKAASSITGEAYRMRPRATSSST